MYNEGYTEHGLASYGTFKGIISRHTHQYESEEHALSAAKVGMWLFIGSEILLFAGLFSAYGLFRTLYPDLFHESHKELSRIIGTINTVILLISSAFAALAVNAAQRGKQRLLKFYILLVVLLGIWFLINKYFEYSAKFHHNIYPSTNIFFSLYFIMTGLHGFHVFGGVVLFIVIFLLASKGQFSEKYYTPVELSALYWHLVDAIWIYLFPLYYLIS
jgi:cytochrome c oxidase subunit 3